jgi:soluble lytic murein transglycosylase-like protein
MIGISFVASDIGPRRMEFASGPVRFGWGPRNEICLDASGEPCVAALHGELVFDQGQWRVRVREQRLGLWVDGVRVDDCPLRGGETLRIGSQRGPTIQVLYAKQVEAARAPSPQLPPPLPPRKLATKPSAVSVRSAPPDAPRPVASLLFPPNEVQQPIVSKPAVTTRAATPMASTPRAERPVVMERPLPVRPEPPVAYKPAAAPRPELRVEEERAAALRIPAPVAQLAATVRSLPPAEPRAPATASIVQPPPPPADELTQLVPMPPPQVLPVIPSPSVKGRTTEGSAHVEQGSTRRSPALAANGSAASSLKATSNATAAVSPTVRPARKPEPEAEARSLASHGRSLAPDEEQTREAPVEPQRPSSHRPPPARPESTAAKLLASADEVVAPWLKRAVDELQRARAKNQGQSSGHTMIIMASALSGLNEKAQQATERGARRWRRRLSIVGVASLVLVLGLSGVIWRQHQRMTRLVSEKVAIDTEIQAVLDAMAQETDEQKLAELEQRLEPLMGSAAEKVRQVRRASLVKPKDLDAADDPLERDIRTILRAFGAETYAIPPLFKRTVAQHVEEIRSSPVLRANYARKQKYWPQIRRALTKQQLPESLGYIAFTESGFDPSAKNARSGAGGLWQLMPEAAKNCGLTVKDGVDPRFDPARSSEAAACHLSKLLVEFGQESFMLVLASYNRGENGVRRALHKVAQEPGGYKRRDFWHLYRLKLLPPETREYVPKVLAAAIVFGNPERYGLEQVAAR